MTAARTRRHASYWAFVGHRVSGVLLALFLPLHFLTLGLALEGAERLDSFLTFAELPMVKAMEWALVILLGTHFFFGLRLLALEFLPWPAPLDARKGWIGWGAGATFVIGVLFLMSAF